MLNLFGVIIFPNRNRLIDKIVKNIPNNAMSLLRPKERDWTQYTVPQF